MLERLATAWQALDTSKKQVQRPVFRPLSPVGRLEKGSSSRSIGKIKSISPISKRSRSGLGTDFSLSKSQTLVRDRTKVTLRPLLSKAGLSAEVSESLYRARCEDLDLPVLADQIGKFQEFCTRNTGKRRLFLEDTGLGPRCTAIVAHILSTTNHFAYVYLGKNPIRTEGLNNLLPALLETSTVVHLGLNSVDMTPEFSVQLFNSLHSHPSIGSLDFSSDGVHKNRLAGKGAEAASRLLRTNMVLYALNIAGTALGTEGAEVLAAGLSENWTLQWLDISDNGISGKVWATLGEAIDKSKVRHLAIGENRLNQIGAEYVGKMAASVYGRCPVTCLNASKCELTPSCLRKLCPGLSQNPFIRRLSLEHNPMTSTSVIEMYQFLADALVLEELNLSKCELTGDSLDTVAAGLSKNRTLLRLYLAGNGFGDCGAKALAVALERNCTLKTLDLTANLIRTEGGASLAHSLDLNRSLETLILTDNTIGDSTGQLLADLTKQNRTLTTVLLHNNPINPTFLQAIRKSAVHNRTRKQRSLTPLLRSEVRSLLLPSSAFSDLSQALQTKKEEAVEARVLLELQQQRMQRIAEEEGSRLTVLQLELAQCKQSRGNREKELQDLLGTAEKGEI